MNLRTILRSAGLQLLRSACLLLVLAGSLGAEEKAPVFDLAKAFTGMDPATVEAPIRALVLITVLSVVPSIILLATSYPRIFIVLSFLRRALGAQDLPSNQILAGLTLILTALIMLPIWKRVHAEAYLPLTRGEIKTTEEALDRAAVPVKQFMLQHTLEKDLRLFAALASEGKAPAQARTGTSGPAGASLSREKTEPTVEDLSFFTVLPAFVLSELKLAFQLGFLLCLPFLVIDLAVSAVLLSMGMFLLPPAMVSLPLKVLVFVLADGWNLVVAQLIQGFQVLG